MGENPCIGTLTKFCSAMLERICSVDLGPKTTFLTLLRIQADPVNFGPAGWAGFDRFLIVVGTALTMTVLSLVRPCLVLAGSSQSPTLVLAGLVMNPAGLAWPPRIALADPAKY